MWRIKVLVQFVLAHVPYGEAVNFALQERRGAYSGAALLRSFLVQAEHVRRLNSRHPLAGATVVEIGPGWKGLGLVVLSLFGVERVHSFDHVPHLRFDIMRRLIDIAAGNLDAASEASGLARDVLAERLRLLQASTDLPGLLTSLRVDYHAPADAGCSGLPDRSVDLVYSYGVLEHVPERGLHAITAECARILKPTGRAFHNIGMHDHYEGVGGLAHGVNFLRYPEWAWKLLVDNRIAYHNRLRLPAFLKIFDDHGATVAWSDTELLAKNLQALDGLPVDRLFAGLTPAELATSHLYVDLAWP